MTPAVPSLGEGQCEFCGHIFDTRDERVRHEQAGRRGERVLCPCGDVCMEFDPDA